MTLLLLAAFILGSIAGYIAGGCARKAGEADAIAEHNAWLITPTTANLANVEAILEAGSPISREDSLALCDALRRAWRENREQSALLLVAEAKLEANGSRTLSFPTAVKVVP